MVLETKIEESSPVAHKPDHLVQFTGIVVTYNEERHLRECLNSLAFCEQLVVIDLGSTDASVEIARQYGAEVSRHERVPVVEMIRQEAIDYARNAWVVFMDPDEVLPPGIEDDLRVLIAKKPNLASIKVPWQYYFKGKPLHYTSWGRKQEKGRVHHKDRVRFNPYVHQVIQLLDGYSSATVPRKPNHHIKHYWVDSYRQMFEKHWRYIKLEGESRYNSSQRFSWRSMLRDTAFALKVNLINDRGLYGGFTGIFLSLFYSWYVFMGGLSLRKYERRQRSLQKNTETTDNQE